MTKRNRMIDENGIEHVQCHGPLCNGRMVPISEFNNNYCKECDALKHRERREANFLGYKVEKIKSNSKKRRKECPVAENIEQLIAQLQEKQNMRCYYSGVDLMEKVNNKNSWSVDRKDFNQGYIDGNIALCTNEINLIKGTIEINLEKVEVSLKEIEVSLEKLITSYGVQVGSLTFSNILKTLNEVRNNKLDSNIIKILNELQNNKLKVGT